MRSVQFGLMRSVLIASLTDHAIRMGALATATARRCLAKGRQILDSRCQLRGLECDEGCHPDVAHLVGRIHSTTLVRKRVRASAQPSQKDASSGIGRPNLIHRARIPLPLAESTRRTSPPHTLRIAGLTSGSFRSTGCFATMDNWRGFCCPALKI
jgi:hypothetical protein